MDVGGRGGVVTNDNIYTWHHNYYIIRRRKLRALRGIVRTYDHNTTSVVVELKMWWLNDSYFFRCKDPGLRMSSPPKRRGFLPRRRHNIICLPSTYGVDALEPPWELVPRRFPFAWIPRLYNTLYLGMCYGPNTPRRGFIPGTYLRYRLFVSFIIILYQCIPLFPSHV